MINLFRVNALRRVNYSYSARIVSRFNAKRQLIPVRGFTSDVKDIKQQVSSVDSDESASTTGVLDQETTETVLYFDHVSPFGSTHSQTKQYWRWLIAPLQKANTTETMRQKVIEISSPLPENSRITDLIPLHRDSGAFVKFEVPAELSKKEFVTKVILNVKKHERLYTSNFFLKFVNHIWRLFPSAYVVKGTPWIEDLRRFPSAKLKVIYEGDSLTEEELYLLFRRYGLIVDIIPAKDSATVVFELTRSAVCAKNCITGISLSQGATVLHLQYIPIKRVNYITDFIMSHQRISIPIIIAILATAAVLIFDPIRLWFVEQKITRKYSITAYRDNKYLQSLFIPLETVGNWLGDSYDYIDSQIHGCNGQTDDTEDDTSIELTMGTLWSERFEKAKQLKLWIHENINTYIIIKGPKGSGKEEFVLEHSIRNDEDLNRNVLYINCDSLGKSRSDSSLIKNASIQLGYFPVFSWTNSVTQFVDLGVQGLTGQSSGLSQSKESELKNMFSLAAQAIRNVALVDYQKYKKSIKRRSTNNEEDQLKLLKEDEYLQHNPKCKPIVIINNFARKSESSRNDFIYPIIADWTSNLIQNNIAHVIFITSDVGSIQHLNDSLPNQVFKTISLSDASSKNAKQFLINQLKNENPKVLENSLEPLGGRMLDLQSFVRRIKSGESPEDAIGEMVNQAAEQITTFFLNNSKADKGEVDSNWSPSQIWLIMKLLNDSGEIKFENLVNSPLFNNSNETLSTLGTLEKFDLITLSRNKGVLEKILTGRPLYKAAFKNLIDDVKIFKLYEIDLLKSLINSESSTISKLESELISINSIGSKVDNRINYLSKKIESSNEKIVDLENKIAEIKKLGSKDGHKSFLGIF